MTQVGLETKKRNMDEGVVNSGFVVSDSNLNARRMKARTKKFERAHMQIKRREEKQRFLGTDALRNAGGWVCIHCIVLTAVGLVCVYK